MSDGVQRRLWGIVVGLLCLTLWHVQDLDAQNTSQGQESGNGKSWFFVFNVASGSLEAKPNTKNIYILTLRNVEYGVAFTDRPVRDVRGFTAQKLINIWWNGSDSFHKTPPNAVLDLQDGKDEISVFVLNEPRYDAKNKVLTFEVKHLNEQPFDHARALPLRKERNEVPREFKNAVFLIDSIFSAGFG
ncbi:hypothetical protein JYU14_03325 [Simkania negevensis]|uniref:Uncharacterized protein n=1 Tax=Simkania negevensis TaxID=83561 RepID=A0ABS3ARV2_9BACT|nr:hypothetical protein [Simkania negevensis]